MSYRSKVLDVSNDAGVADAIKQALEDLGYEPEQAIPGLVQAIILLAEYTSDPEAALDEAANLLADSGVTS
jgi:hypothetical protein